MSFPETDFDRERQWWNAKALREEQDSADELINRELRWREIERHLPGTKTILDVGGATGAFSIPLAKRGFWVTHFDLSSEMLSIAQEKARDVPNIEFCEGVASDLQQFPDHSFDLVLNMDGAISFSGSKATIAIQESCRVAKSKVVLTVSHRAQMAVSWLQASVAKTKKLGPAVDAMIERGEWHLDQFAGNGLLTEGMTQNYLGALKAFLPGELTTILESAGMQILRCGGLGSLAGLCSQETLVSVSNDQGLLESFLSLCERFDAEILPSGPGTRHRAGLIAVANRPAQVF
jgi:ubiquinone/menaquinone biosynthesis C-methylase UbiE